MEKIKRPKNVYKRYGYYNDKVELSLKYLFCKKK